MPMRLRDNQTSNFTKSDTDTIRKVLAADRFEIHELTMSQDTVDIVINTKFRSTAQVVGVAVPATILANKIKFANITLVSSDLLVASYRVDLDKITFEQTAPTQSKVDQASVVAVDPAVSPISMNKQRFIWGLGPYIEHRLFNPDLPLSVETGIEVEGGYRIAPGLKLSAAIRKSVLTNLTKKKRLILVRYYPVFKRPLYDLAGQDGHLYSLTLSYLGNIASGVYGRSTQAFWNPTADLVEKFSTNPPNRR